MQRRSFLLALASAARLIRRRPHGAFARRFMQTTGPVMAKGVEDTAFYRYTVLTSATEVGGNPVRASITPDELTSWATRMSSLWPVTMTTLTTHDTKRGEDVRAAISVLTEWAPEWCNLVTKLRARHAADRPAEGAFHSESGHRAGDVPRRAAGNAAPEVVSLAHEIGQGLAESRKARCATHARSTLRPPSGRNRRSPAET